MIKFDTTLKVCQYPCFCTTTNQCPLTPISHDRQLRAAKVFALFFE